MRQYFRPSGSQQRTGRGLNGDFPPHLFPIIWALTDSSYQNVVSGQREDKHPALVRGGVLADVRLLFCTILYAWSDQYSGNGARKNAIRHSTNRMAP